MGYNPRQKYQVVKDGQIFTVTKELYPQIQITFIKSRKFVFLEANYFEDALSDGRIKKLSAKTVSKPAYKHPEWLRLYLIERDKIIEDENRNKTVIGK